MRYPALTVACVWVKANVPYDASYVIKLRNMVKRHLTISYRFVCITNQAELLPDDIECSKIKHPKYTPGWWAKINVFDPEVVGTEGRVLYLDLDTIVLSDLLPIANRSQPLCIIPTEGNFQGRGNLKVIKKYNSSVMSYNVNACKDLAKDWTVSDACRLWGDQDWIAERRPDANLFPLEWFPRLSNIGVLGPDKKAKVVLCKSPKNHEAAKKLAWVEQRWV